MGEYCNKGVSVPQPRLPSLYRDGQAAGDRRFLKHVLDNVHGNITLDPLSLKFIDTEQFQRLRDLKQLGLTYLVYPGAVHTRFEHSLGVYWLAGESLRFLQTYHGAEIDIDLYDIQIVKLAGLLHDIGHGPFSHLFEREFLPQVLPGSEWSHEQMSVELVDYMVDEHHIDIDSDHLRKVKEMIVASSKFAVPRSSKEKQFLYDIVANGRNGIDVDKFDYIGRDCRACGLGCNFQYQRLFEGMRVMGDEICYPAKEYLSIHKLFSARADLHRTVYTHSKVKSIELMAVDALVKANGYLKISSYPFDPAEYWKLDDTILKTIEFADSKKLKESKEIIQRIRRRDLYQFCNEYAVPKEKLEHFKDITPQDIICSQKANGINLKAEDIVVSNVKIDLTRGKHNPLERYQNNAVVFGDFHKTLVHWLDSEVVITFLHGYVASISFFKDYYSEEKFNITDDRISHLLPACYQDRIVRVYAKKPELVEAVAEAFENLQLRMYGVKTQVHETPEKKRRRA